MFTAQDAQLPFCQNRVQRYNKKMTYTSKNRKIARNGRFFFERTIYDVPCTIDVRFLFKDDVPSYLNSFVNPSYIVHLSFVHCPL